MGSSIKRKTLIEFYPELEYLISKEDIKNQSEQILLTQSKYSLRLYLRARTIKRKINIYKQKNRLNRNDLILLKKHSSLSLFRGGKKPNARISYGLVVNGKYIYYERKVHHKDLEAIIYELVNHC